MHNLVTVAFEHTEPDSPLRVCMLLVLENKLASEMWLVVAHELLCKFEDESCLTPSSVCPKLVGVRCHFALSGLLRGA